LKATLRRAKEAAMRKNAMVWAAVILFLLAAVANTDPPREERPKPLLTLRGHKEAVTRVEFSPDGTRLATTGVDHALLLWDATSGKRLLTLKGRFCGLYTTLSFSPDGKHLAAPAASPSLNVWDTASGRPHFALTGHEDFSLLAAFSPTGRHLATADWANPRWNGVVQLRDARTGAGVATLRATRVSSLAYSHDGRRLATGGEDGAVTVWETASRSRSLLLKGRDGGYKEIVRVVLSWDGRRLADADGLCWVRVRALPSGRECWTQKRDEGHAIRLMFSPDGGWLAAGWTQIRLEELPNGNAMPRFYRGKVVVWDARTGEERLTLPAAEGEPGVYDFCFSPDGARVATGHEDGTVRIWSVEQLLGRGRSRRR
jgi:WD40 repeat protein